MSVVRASGLTFELDGEFREEVITLFTAGAIDALPRLLVLVTPPALGLDGVDAAQATTEALLRASSGAQSAASHTIELRATSLGGRAAMEATTTLASGARWRAWHLEHGALRISYLRVCDPDDEARVDAIAQALATGEGWAAPACPAGLFDHSARTLRSTSGPAVQIELRRRRTQESSLRALEELSSRGLAVPGTKLVRLAPIDDAPQSAELWLERTAPRGLLLEMSLATPVEAGLLLVTMIAPAARRPRLEALRAAVVAGFSGGRPARA